MLWTTSRQSTRRLGQLASHASHVRGEKTRFDGQAGPRVCTLALKISLMHLGRQRAVWLGVPDARDRLYTGGLAVYCVFVWEDFFFSSAVATWTSSELGKRRGTNIGIERYIEPLGPETSPRSNLALTVLGT